MSWKFAVDGDLHFEASGACRKPNSVRKLLSLKPDFVLCPGDLLNDGGDGSAPLLSCSCVKGKRGPTQLEQLRDLYAAPLDAAGIRPYLCLGNHDRNGDSSPAMRALDYVGQRHGATVRKKDPDASGCYSFDHKGVQFVVCGCYPKDLAWLRELMARTPKRTPLVFCWHYNTDPSQPWADWWKQEEKDAFFAAVQDRVDAGRALVAFNGHWHESTTSLYRGVPVALCSREDRLTVVKVSPDASIESIETC